MSLPDAVTTSQAPPGTTIFTVTKRGLQPSLYDRFMADHDDPPDRTIASTAGIEYTRRLRQLGERRWKQILNVQAPYRWNVRSLRLGRTLDIGCGIGRNLHFLGASSVGVDHNADSVALARERGLEAYSTEEFAVSAPSPESFDSLLVAHVVEH